jgi:hypothetical protein
VKIFMPTGASEPIYAPYTEHYPPDTAAAIWWLKNRQPKLWRDFQKIDVDVNVTHDLAPELRSVMDSLLSLAESAALPLAIEGKATEVDTQDVVSPTDKDEPQSAK